MAAAPTVRIEFLKDWQVYPAGRVVEFDHPGVAAELVRRGIARPVVPPDRPLAKKPKGR